MGPPTLSWLFQGHSLSINVSVPLTPFRSKKGSYKPVNKVLLKLWYWLHLYDGEVLTQQVRGGGGDTGKKGTGHAEVPWCNGDALEPAPHCAKGGSGYEGADGLHPPQNQGVEGDPFSSSGLQAY